MPACVSGKKHGVSVIEEANWLSLSDDLSDVDGVPEGGFDAVLCLNNSFSNLPDFEGSPHYQKVALSNFREMIKPRGILVIDHRNFICMMYPHYSQYQKLYWCHQSIEYRQRHGRRRPRIGRRGGGVILHVKESIQADEIKLESEADYDEAVWCEIVSGNSKLTIELVYRGPNLKEEDNTKIQNAIKEVSKGECIIMGDFNHGHIQ